MTTTEQNQIIPKYRTFPFFFRLRSVNLTTCSLTIEYQQPAPNRGEIRAALWGEKGVRKEVKRRQKGGAMGAKRRHLGGAKAALFSSA
jgi:hypothetical protein